MFSKRVTEHTAGHPKAKARWAAVRGKQIKTIEQVPQVPMDAWQVAAHLFGQEAVDKNHLLASKAADQMEEAGWIFVEYDLETGEEVWYPPK